MRVLVIGAGAIGGAAAGYLAGAGHDVLALDAWPEHVAAINASGIAVTGVRGDHRFPLRACAWAPGEAVPDDVGDHRPETVIVSVKSRFTPAAIDVIARAPTRDITVVSLQNGVNEEVLAAALGDVVVGAVTEIGGYIEAPGHVVETRADGGFVMGDLDGGSSERLRAAAGLLTACAPVSLTDDILGQLWSKLTWNCMINGLCALTGLGQGEVVGGADTRRIALVIGQEVARVAERAGVRLQRLDFLGIDLPSLVDPSAPGHHAAQRALVARYSTQLKKSTSMSEDVRHGRLTEVDALNGFAADKGRATGVPTPTNERVVRLVHEVEQGELSPGVHVVSLLLARATSEGKV